MVNHGPWAKQSFSIVVYCYFVTEISGFYSKSTLAWEDINCSRGKKFFTFRSVAFFYFGGFWPQKKRKMTQWRRALKLPSTLFFSITLFWGLSPATHCRVAVDWQQIFWAKNRPQNVYLCSMYQWHSANSSVWILIPHYFQDSGYESTRKSKRLAYLHCWPSETTGK